MLLFIVMKLLFRIASGILILSLSAYLIVVFSPVKDIIRHRIESVISKTTGIKIEVDSLSTDLFTTVVLKNLVISPKEFTSLTVDKLVLRFSPFFNKKLSGYVIDKKLNALFSIDLGYLFKPRGIDFRIFPSNPLKPKDFFGGQFRALNDIKINGETAIFGKIFFNGGKMPEISIDLILSAVSINSEKLGFYLNNASGNIPFTTSPNEMKEGIFIKNMKIRDMSLENIRADIVSHNSLLNLNNFEYNIYDGEGKGSLSFSLSDFSFILNSNIKSLDLEKFDNASKGFKTKTEGVVDLDISVGLKGGVLETLEVKANSDKSGRIKQEVILALLNYLPKEQQTAQLVNELLKEKEFVYNRLSGEFAKRKEGYKMHLVLDGTHLLEFNINIEEGVLDTLLRMFK